MVASLSSRLLSYPIPCGECLLFEMLSILMSWAGLHPSFLGSHNRNKNYRLGARRVHPLLGGSHCRGGHCQRALEDMRRSFSIIMISQNQVSSACLLSCVSYSWGPSCLNSKSHCLCCQVPLHGPVSMSFFLDMESPGPCFPAPRHHYSLISVISISCCQRQCIETVQC